MKVVGERFLESTEEVNLSGTRTAIGRTSGETRKEHRRSKIAYLLSY